jgi:hypothetical protein
MGRIVTSKMDRISVQVVLWLGAIVCYTCIVIEFLHVVSASATLLVCGKVALEFSTRY